MQLNTAQTFILSLCENANFGRSYKAPHAYRGTPSRPTFPRNTRTKKLFKGHRP